MMSKQSALLLVSAAIGSETKSIFYYAKGCPHVKCFQTEHLAPCFDARVSHAFLVHSLVYDAGKLHSSRFVMHFHRRARLLLKWVIACCFAGLPVCLSWCCAALFGRTILSFVCHRQHGATLHDTVLIVIVVLGLYGCCCSNTVAVGN